MIWLKLLLILFNCPSYATLTTFWNHWLLGSLSSIMSGVAVFRLQYVSTEVLVLSSLFLQRMIHLSTLPSSAQVTQSVGGIQYYAEVIDKYILKLIPITFSNMTNKCAIISQIITLLHFSTLSRHPHGACNQYLAQLHKYFKCSCWEHKLQL